MAAPSLLVVDDDKIYHFLMTRLLDTLNAGSKVSEIKQVYSGQDALVYLKEHLGDKRCIVLLDLNMPSMSGFEFLDVLTGLPEICELCAVYIVTSSVNESDREKADEYEVVKGYLVKPVKRSVLEELLDEEVEALS